jgi:hypothetical protein
MAQPKDKSPKARAPREERFDPFWNKKSGTVASKDDYLYKIRERAGFHRGAKVKIRNPN